MDQSPAESQSRDDAPQRAHTHRLHAMRIALGVGLALVGASAFGAVLLVGLTSAQPQWWAATPHRVVAAAHPEAALEEAERIERGVATTLHRRRDLDQPWTVVIEAADANTWIGSRLPMWLENRGARIRGELPEIRVGFHGGRVLLGIEPRASHGRVITVEITPRVGERGDLWMPATGLRLGRLALPTSMLEENARAYFPADARADPTAAATLDAAMAALADEAPAFDPATVNLDDGRRVRLTQVRVEEDKLLLTFVTDRKTAQRD